MGRMSVRAYVNEHSNFEFASAAIKNDVIRTFKARMEMHYDSLVGEEMGGTDDNLPILHEPPRRVNICLPDDSITVSDLLFPGETPEESVKAVEEMLGFTPQFEQLDDELEIVASPQTVKVPFQSKNLDKKYPVFGANTRVHPIIFFTHVPIIVYQYFFL